MLVYPSSIPVLPLSGLALGGATGDVLGGGGVEVATGCTVGLGIIAVGDGISSGIGIWEIGVSEFGIGDGLAVFVVDVSEGFRVAIGDGISPGIGIWGIGVSGGGIEDGLAVFVVDVSEGFRVAVGDGISPGIGIWGIGVSGFGIEDGLVVLVVDPFGLVPFKEVDDDDGADEALGTTFPDLFWTSTIVTPMPEDTIVPTKMNQNQYFCFFVCSLEGE